MYVHVVFSSSQHVAQRSGAFSVAVEWLWRFFDGDHAGRPVGFSRVRVAVEGRTVEKEDRPVHVRGGSRERLGGTDVKLLEDLAKIYGS